MALQRSGQGITNLLLPDRNTIAIADREDLIFLDSRNGKRTVRTSHKIERASFALLNQGGDVVIGGQSEIAAFDPSTGWQRWRARHTPPGRGIVRTVAAIAARVASLYFHFGGTAMTAVRGVQIARKVTSLSWSGLAARSSFSNCRLSRLRRHGITARHVSNNSVLRRACEAVS